MTLNVRSSNVTFLSGKVTKTICHLLNSSYFGLKSEISQKQFDINLGLSRTAADDVIAYRIRL